MKLTKYEHACFTLETDRQVLVVDPGNFTTDFVPLENVAAIVVTHEHGDHFDLAHIDAIMSKNPAAVIIAHPIITNQLPHYSTRSVTTGDSITQGPFTLTFYGSEHAIIHPDIASVTNLGVMINATLYYPGDSFYEPGVPVDMLALPVGAPWLKISEAIDFVRAVKPRLVFPTHDAVLSPIGQELSDRLVSRLAPDAEYSRLGASSIDI